MIPLFCKYNWYQSFRTDLIYTNLFLTEKKCKIIPIYKLNEFCLVINDLLQNSLIRNERYTRQ